MQFECPSTGAGRFPPNSKTVIAFSWKLDVNCAGPSLKLSLRANQVGALFSCIAEMHFCRSGRKERGLTDKWLSTNTIHRYVITNYIYLGGSDVYVWSASCSFRLRCPRLMGCMLRFVNFRNILDFRRMLFEGVRLIYRIILPNKNEFLSRIPSIYIIPFYWCTRKKWALLETVLPWNLIGFVIEITNRKS